MYTHTHTSVIIFCYYYLNSWTSGGDFDTESLTNFLDGDGDERITHS